MRKRFIQEMGSGKCMKLRNDNITSRSYVLRNHILALQDINASVLYFL